MPDSPRTDRWSEFTQAGSRCAIEEVARHLQFNRNLSFDLLLLGCHFEFDPLGDVILDHEGGLADRLALGIGKGARPPGPGRDG